MSPRELATWVRHICCAQKIVGSKVGLKIRKKLTSKPNLHYRKSDRLCIWARKKTWSFITTFDLRDTPVCLNIYFPCPISGCFSSFTTSFLLWQSGWIGGLFAYWDGNLESDTQSSFSSQAPAENILLWVDSFDESDTLIIMHPPYT